MSGFVQLGLQQREPWEPNPTEGAFVPRAYPRDLRIASEVEVSADWPLAYDDLLPYYVEVEGYLGV